MIFGPDYIVGNFACCAPLTSAGVDVLLNRGYVNQLADNIAVRDSGVLTPSQWKKMFHKAPVELATKLVARPLCEELVQVGLKDRRTSVQIGLITHNELKFEDVISVPAQAGIRLCKEILKVYSKPVNVWSHCDRTLLAQIAYRAGGLDTVRWISHLDPTTREKAARERFAEFETMKLNRRIRWSGAFRDMVTRHPELAMIAVETGLRSTSAIAGSPSLGDDKVNSAVRDKLLSAWPQEDARFGLLKFISAPRTNITLLAPIADLCRDSEILKAIERRRSTPGRSGVNKPFQEVTDVSTLHWLIKRAAPFWSRTGSMTRAKREELFLLCVNDTVRDDLELANEVGAALRKAVESGSLTTKEFGVARAALLGNKNITLDVMFDVQYSLSEQKLEEVVTGLPQGIESNPARKPETSGINRDGFAVEDLSEAIWEATLGDLVSVLFEERLCRNGSARSQPHWQGGTVVATIAFELLSVWLVEELTRLGLDDASHWESLVTLMATARSVRVRELPELVSML